MKIQNQQQYLLAKVEMSSIEYQAINIRHETSEPNL